MDWDAVLKRENKKAIEAKKYGELLKQQTDEDKERKIKERKNELEVDDIYFMDSPRKNITLKNSNNNTRLLNNTLNNKNEFSNDSLNLFQKDILSEKTNLKLNPILFSDNLSSNNNINRNINNNYNSNSNSNRSINSNFDSNNSIFNDNLKNLLSSNYTNDGNSNITNNILDSISINNHDSIEYKPSIGNKDKIRKKKDRRRCFN